MIVAVQATNEFEDYNVFIRAMGVALSGMNKEDKYFYIYSAGPAKLNGFVTEFTNLSERGMKLRGKKIKCYKVPSSWIEENISEFNYFAFFKKPEQKVSKLLGVAELNNIEVGIYSY